MSIFYDDLTYSNGGNPSDYCKVMISSSSKAMDPLPTVVGYLGIQDEFSIQLSSNYSDSDLISTAQNNWNDTAGKVYSGYNQVMEMAGAENGQAAQRRFQSARQTIKTWLSFSMQALVLQLIFVATKPEDNVLKVVKSLMSAVTPDIGAATMTAPLEYKADSRGSMILRIGKWFELSNGIMTSANFDMSKACIEAGTPLYARATLTFEPCMITDPRTMLRLV